MYQFIIILILIVCILLAIVVLVQNSKGGGLAANFSAPNQILGVRRTADFLEKATWWLAGILVVLSLLATAVIPHNENDTVDVDNANITMPVQNAPAAPAATATAPTSETAQE